MSQELQVATLGPEQIALIKRTVAKDATPDELALFIGMCKRTKLDPFTRQIYFIKDKSNKVMMQISVDGFRVVAERSGSYAGQDAPVFEEDEKTGKPVKCSVTVYRWHGETRYPASVGVAYWAEYNRPGRNGYESNWDKLPRTMLAKVAECIALRKAFPNDLSGLYSAEEMDQANNIPTPTPENGYLGGGGGGPSMTTTKPYNRDLEEDELPVIEVNDDFSEDIGEMKPPDFLAPTDPVEDSAAVKAMKAGMINPPPEYSITDTFPAPEQPYVEPIQSIPLTVLDSCWKHNCLLKPGKKEGTVYCQTKLPDGTWCKSWKERPPAKMFTK